MLVRLVMFAIVAVFVFAAAQIVLDTVRRAAARRAEGGPLARVPRRRSEGAAGREDVAGILRFSDAHEGVEAYVEPATSVTPRSVVLVDGDGEWSRFPLGGDRALRALVDRGIPVYDVTKLGYPKRMRGRDGGSGSARG